MPGGLNLSWRFSPGVLIVIILMCLLYGLGVWWARRSSALEKQLHVGRVLAFVIAMLGMIFALLTPLATIARTQLFSAHMFQFVILTTLSAPLLLLACPNDLLQPVLLRPIVHPIARVLTFPLVASFIFNINFFVWHTPAIFHAALGDATLYDIEMLSFFCAALLNWWPLIGSVHELRRMSYPLQMLYAFLDGQPVDIFAFILVFTGTVVYPYYAIPPQLGLPAFSDQAVGGALLLIPGIVDLVVMSPLFVRWLAQMEERQKIKDRQLQEMLAAQEAEGAEAQSDPFNSYGRD